MTDMPMEDMDRTQQERERETDRLLEEQEGDSDGEDEGALDQPLPGPEG
jgi:hypothetical protein